MSARPSHQDASANQSGDGKTGAPSCSSTVAPSSQLSPSSDARQLRLAHDRSLDLPQLPPPSSIAGGSLSAPRTRIAGVSSILNPAPEDDSPSSRVRKAFHLDSSDLSSHALPAVSLAQRTASAYDARPQSPTVQYDAQLERQPRRILTPRSPSLHRAASLGQLSSTSGSISVHGNAYPSSPRGRAYYVEPGTSNAPPLPTPTTTARSAHGFAAPASYPDAARMATASVVHPRQPSSSASPTTSYSSHTGQASPASRYESTGLTTLSGPYTTNGEIQIGGAGTASAFEQHHPASIPISSSGAQSVYQMMTLETSSGTVQLPVDVQAASRVADEKRRRNAGASARFRQRRKEKEREAATTIAALQQDVKELSEQVTFYRGERTYFAQVLSQMPGGERHLSRPPSPRHHHRRHHAMPPHPPSDSEGYGYTSMPDHEARSPNEGRNVRRRTSTYSLPPPPPPPPQQQPPSMPPPPPQAVFHGQPGRGTAQSMTSGPLPSPLTLEPLPPPPSYFAPSSFAQQQQQQQQQQGPPGPPPPVMQAYPQPGPSNPYAPDRRTSGAPGPKREG